MFSKVTVAAIICLTAGRLSAGIPIEVDMICPVGGEEFTIMETASCSTMGRTMSFRPETSCDFVTRLPVCPSNGLPVYKEFSADEVATLSKYIETKPYLKMNNISDWIRAYFVAEQLAETGTGTTFWLLLNGLWYDSERFLMDETAMQMFALEVDQELARAPSEDRPFIKAIFAYALAASGQTDAAKDKISEVEGQPDISEFLSNYLKAIRACLPNMTDKTCTPDAPFDG